MELRLDGAGYAIIGTPKEMLEFMTLKDKQTAASEPVEDVAAPDPGEQEPKMEPTPEAKQPKAKRPKAKPATDWAKARALRLAGWTYKDIARELHVSAQTVANHIDDKGAEEK